MGDLVKNNSQTHALLPDNLPPSFYDFVNDLYSMAGITGHSEHVSTTDLNKALDALRKKVMTSKNGQALGNKKSKSAIHNEFVMIIGLLGIINYQLKNIANRLGSKPVIVNTVEDAVAEFQKQDYKKIIIDLYMPTEYEGFQALDEIRKISVICNMKFQIIVLSNPSERALESEAIIKGADHFIVRTDGWQDKLSELLSMDDEQNAETNGLGVNIPFS